MTEGFQLGPEWRPEIDEWRSGEPGHLSRSDAVRMGNEPRCADYAGRASRRAAGAGGLAFC